MFILENERLRFFPRKLLENFLFLRAPSLLILPVVPCRSHTCRSHTHAHAVPHRSPGHRPTADAWKFSFVVKFSFLRFRTHSAR